MTKPALIWEQKQNAHSCYFKLNNNMEAHAEIYPMDNHFEVSIDFVCIAVSYEFLQKKLAQHEIPMKIVDMSHPDFCLRGDCLLYKETMSSVRDGKIRFEIWRDDVLRSLNL